MSEYQCYQWKKVGQRLSSKERKEVSNLSSHITVTGSSAEVSYHYGDFKHDPQDVLLGYFDIFLYEADWGEQQVIFRLDSIDVDQELLSLFMVGESLSVTQSEGDVLIEVWLDENWIDPSCSYCDQNEFEGSRYLDSFAAIYEEIQEGDYRGLFLLWLKCCELDFEETHVVNLPKGLMKLKEEHQVVAEFVGVDQRLIEQAAKRSQPLPHARKANTSLEKYLSKLSTESRDEYLKRLLLDEANSVQRALRDELKQYVIGRPLTCLGELISFEELADAVEKEAEAKARKTKEEKEKHRLKYLKKLEEHEHEILNRAYELVSEKKTKSYDEAVILLRGLEDLWVTRNDHDHFLITVQGFVKKFPRLTGFQRRLESAGWLTFKKDNLRSAHLREKFQEENPIDREIDFNLLATKV